MICLICGIFFKKQTNHPPKQKNKQKVIDKRLDWWLLRKGQRWVNCSAVCVCV